MARRNGSHQEDSNTTDNFLGEGEKIEASVIEPRYYGELLAWALHHYIELEGWQVTKTLGYLYPEPVYIAVNTSYEEYEDALRNGLLFVEKGENRFAIAVDVNLRSYNIVVVTGLAGNEKGIDEFANGIRSFAREQNFYRGKKLELRSHIRFLKPPARTWDSIVLDTAVKDEIWTNTIGFLTNREHIANYGIPAKRGVLLTGEPGTGKTVICKALMAESSKVTYIIASAYSLETPEYITELYELAQDLSPCIVFIEDIDFIAQSRMESGYFGNSVLFSLLSALDGVEEHEEIVTVATTNWPEVIDKAIGERPARFDCVIKLSLPSLEQRGELVSLLCNRIPIDETTQAYIARKAEHCTPAQLQEVIYRLIIEHQSQSSDSQLPYLKFSTDDIDSVISKVKRSRNHLGFDIPRNHHSDETE
jgi:cell division protease FtsH